MERVADVVKVHLRVLPFSVRVFFRITITFVVDDFDRIQVSKFIQTLKQPKLHITIQP